jgi:hypothetical protein
MTRFFAKKRGGFSAIKRGGLSAKKYRAALS